MKKTPTLINDAFNELMQAIVTMSGKTIGPYLVITENEDLENKIILLIFQKVLTDEKSSISKYRNVFHHEMLINTLEKAINKQNIEDEQWQLLAVLHNLNANVAGTEKRNKYYKNILFCIKEYLNLTIGPQMKLKPRDQQYPNETLAAGCVWCLAQSEEEDTKRGIWLLVHLWTKEIMEQVIDSVK